MHKIPVERLVLVPNRVTIAMLVMLPRIDFELKAKLVFPESKWHILIFCLFVFSIGLNLFAVYIMKYEYFDTYEEYSDNR